MIMQYRLACIQAKKRQESRDKALCWVVIAVIVLYLLTAN
jgi:hypothetical protein